MLDALPASAAAPARDPGPCCPEIALLVAYTGAAQSCAGATPGAIELVIAAAVELANATFTNSGVNLVFVLRHAYRAEGFSECCQDPAGGCFGIYNDCNLLAGANDTVLDEIHTLRSVYGADIAMLFTDYYWGCPGRAITTGADESTAFAIVNQMWAVDDMELAHEAGHLFGARHVEPPTTTPFSFGHGYCGPCWRTVMALPSDCGGVDVERIPFWSNPEMTYPSAECHPAPFGTYEYSNNARVLRESACTVAGFRVPGALAVSPPTVLLRRGRSAVLGVAVTREAVAVSAAPVRSLARDEGIAGVQEWVSTDPFGHALISVEGRSEGSTSVEVRSEGAVATVPVKIVPAASVWGLLAVGAVMVALAGRRW